MQFGSREDFSSRSCSASDCSRKLVDGVSEDLTFEDGLWYHTRCLLRAKHALAEATKLARLAYAVHVYAVSRENIDAVQGDLHGRQ